MLALILISSLAVSNMVASHHNGAYDHEHRFHGLKDLKDYSQLFSQTKCSFAKGESCDGKLVCTPEDTCAPTCDDGSGFGNHALCGGGGRCVSDKDSGLHYCSYSSKDEEHDEHENHEGGEPRNGHHKHGHENNHENGHENDSGNDYGSDNGNDYGNGNGNGYGNDNQYSTSTAELYTVSSATSDTSSTTTTTSCTEKSSDTATEVTDVPTDTTTEYIYTTVTDADSNGISSPSGEATGKSTSSAALMVIEYGTLALMAILTFSQALQY